MYALPALFAIPFWSIFAYTLLGIIIIGSVYFFYKRYQEQRHRARQSEFAVNQQERDYRVEQIREHTVSSLEIQNNADQILLNIKQQQTHLEQLIGLFEQRLSEIQTIDMGLVQTNDALQNKIISPLSHLVTEMREKYAKIHLQITQLAQAFSHSTQVLVAQEREIARIVHNFSDVESQAQKGMNALSVIDTTIDRYKRHIAERDKTIQELTKRASTLLKIKEEQDEVITLLKEQVEALHGNDQLETGKVSRRNSTSGELKLFKNNSPPHKSTPGKGSTGKRTPTSLHVRYSGGSE